MRSISVPCARVATVFLAVVLISMCASIHSTSEATEVTKDVEPPSGDSPDSLQAPAEIDSLDIARNLFAERKLVEAEALIRRLIPRMESEQSPVTKDVASALNLLVPCLWQTGRSQEDETIALAQRAVDVCEDVHGTTSLEHAWALFNAGVIRAMGGDYESAEPIFAQTLEIREALLPPAHEEVASSINALANIRFLNSDFVGALPLYRRSLRMAEGFGGPLNRQAISVRGNVAVTLIELGDLDEAREVLDQQIRLLEAEEMKTEDLAYAYSLLGKMFKVIEDFEEAARVYRRSLEIREAFHPEDHPRIAESSLNLGQSLLKTGQIDECRSLTLRGMEIWERKYGSDHPYFYAFVSALAQLAIAEERFEEARKFQEQALGILEDVIGPDTPQAAELLQPLGQIALAQGNRAEARSYFERASRIVVEQVGARHPFVGEYGYDVAHVDFLNGHLLEAAERSLEAAQILHAHLRLSLRALPDRQALRYARKSELPRGLLFSVIDEIDDPQLTERAWDLLIRSRAMIVDEMAARTRRIALAADSTLHDRLEVYQLAGRRLANIIVRGPQDTDPAKYRHLVEEARVNMENAELNLGRASGDAGPGLTDIGWHAVAGALPEGSALVSYSLYLHHGHDPADIGKPTPRYRAFVLPRSGTAPVTVPIGDAAGFDALINDWRRQASQGAFREDLEPEERLQAYDRVGHLLRELLWDPVAHHVGDARQIFVVPDGQIHLINLVALPAPDGGYLLELPVAVHQLSAERELAAPMARTAIAAEGSALVLGAPDFDRADSPTEIAPTEGPDRFAVSPSFRGQRPNCAELRSHHFTPLPGTLDEAREVAGLWAHIESDSESALLLTGSQASEDAFKRSAPGRRVLHLATHGYFLDPACPSEVDGDTSASETARRTVNPLLLSGLVLAGANAHNSTGVDAEDGVLTAQEIATLDLSAARWAVLSACETAVGEIQSGEGVLGLQRAFRIAGARTLVTSLWSVEDQATRRWMNAFYTACVTQGLDPIRSVRQASLSVLNERRAEGKDAHPFYWGAFIASGDWR